LASTNGFILGLIGGVLDFASASLLLLGGSGGMMNESQVPSYVWAAILIVLGTAVILTSILSVGTIGIRFARVFSVLMVTYGLIMVGIGAAMSTGYIVATGVSVIYSLGMLLVGAGMIANGVMMSRSPMQM
jgi:hypothetical protein